MSKKYPRDMIGYGSKEPRVTWPNNAKLALQIVLNYEEGAENNILHGDKNSETLPEKKEFSNAQPIKFFLALYALTGGFYFFYWFYKNLTNFKDPKVLNQTS